MSVREKRENVAAVARDVIKAANTLIYSVEDLAKRFNCSAKSVYRILATDRTAKQNLHQRRRLIRANVAKALHSAGLSQREIAKYLGGSRSNVGKLLTVENQGGHPHIPISLSGEAKDVHGKKIQSGTYNLQHLSDSECLLIGNHKRAPTTFIVAYGEIHGKVSVSKESQFILPKVSP